MTILKHELRQGRNSLAIWTASIGFLLAICILIFPEMKGEMDAMGDMFSSMGSFSAAFGMDQINFGELKGFYAIECGNILGLGGAFFAALCGISALAKEEHEHTAEFLLTHPISRKRVVLEKLLSIFLQATIMNIIILILAIFSIIAIKEEVPWKDLSLMHLAFYILQLEIGAICFGISAFSHRGGLGIGLGAAAMMYFLNLIANITESAEFLKYITPFGYCEGADILTNGYLNTTMVALGIVYSIVFIAIGFLYYTKKDIQ